ncbi:TetR family transcriptional regulator [Nocardiopsis gilva YIM 90087]|uniref:TetR family transcriptional regulator n=1 Tax=Nocardiopsis gilva YIM 90087 TaxID=1235441 RepID=A0A223S3E6_9ACTN|nr:TetR family transcriptional regulator [Nocardiopsis gilva YIM 90087]
MDLIARTAVHLIASRGLRGLTHRAVDEAAGLPPGSTSYHARTRARLIEIALLHLADEGAALTDPVALGVPASLTSGGLDTMARLIADYLHTTIHEDTERSLARFELALEANRRPELRAVYDGLGRRFQTLATAVLRGLGSPDPQRHARALIAWSEGMVFDSLAGSGAARPPSHDELRTDAAEFLRALLAPADTSVADGTR